MRLRILVPMALALAACGGGDRPSPPDAEFLLLAGDSTFWVSPEAGHLRVRGSPIHLARLGDRLVEIYVADDDRSFEGAILVGQRIYRRDLVTGDSVMVFEDTTIASLASWYAREHPGARRLRPDEEGDREPHVDVLGEVVTVDQHGPYLSFEYRLDGVLENATEMHEVRRGVVDLRDGSRATLGAMFGDTAARRLTKEGAAGFSRAVDSVIASPDARAQVALASLGELAFDPASFTILAQAREPAVEFAAVGRGPAAGLVLPLPPVRAPVPEWWAEVRPAIPAARADSLVDRWERGALVVEARYDSIGDRALLVVAQPRDGGEWRLARVPAPARRLYWLDARRDAAAREALVRAFDEAALYSDDARTVSRPGAGGSVVRHAALTRPAARHARAARTTRTSTTP